MGGVLGLSVYSIIQAICNHEISFQDCKLKEMNRPCNETRQLVGVGSLFLFHLFNNVISRDQFAARIFKEW